MDMKIIGHEHLHQVICKGIIVINDKQFRQIKPPMKLPAASGGVSSGILPKPMAKANKKSRPDMSLGGFA